MRSDFSLNSSTKIDAKSPARELFASKPVNRYSSQIESAKCRLLLYVKNAHKLQYSILLFIEDARVF